VALDRRRKHREVSMRRLKFFRKHGLDLGQSLARGTCNAPSRSCLDHARTDHQRLQLIAREHQRGNV
jgi:hypothetical protein